MAAKVLIIGPQRCGKTRIANCLSDFEASPNFEQYNQTAGVRILETERVIRVEGRSVRQQVRSHRVCERYVPLSHTCHSLPRRSSFGTALETKSMKTAGSAYCATHTE